MALAEPIPKPATPFYGHKGGNFSPASPVSAEHAATNSTDNETVEYVRSIMNRAPGGVVNHSSVRRCDNSNINEGIGGGSDSYRMYWGAGRANEGWPQRSQWVSFEPMFNRNKVIMENSCGQFGQPNNSGPEIVSISSAE